MQSGPSGKANKPNSKVQKQAKKERLRQKRKRVTADAAAAVSTEDAQTLRERNLQYYVETAKADANVQKLMREVCTCSSFTSQTAASGPTTALLGTRQ